MFPALIIAIHLMLLATVSSNYIALSVCMVALCCQGCFSCMLSVHWKCFTFDFPLILTLQYPWDILKKAWGLGLMNASIPQEYG